MLKLFRSTGYSSILAPGETRVLMHPAWLIIAVSLWAGFVCNVGLWRALGTADGPPLERALVSGWLVAAAAGLFLSLLGWRRTLKPAATLVLLLSSVIACGAVAHAVPFDSMLFGRGPIALLPTWASLLQWQMPVLLALLGFSPILWVWSAELRRLPGPSQLRSNLLGMVLAAVVVGGALFLLGR
jgi:glucan phosphoethanolaminetransferase (alkaline phosphatase superfamily)